MPRKTRRIDVAQSAYPIRITSHQREALICSTRLRGKIKNRLNEAGGNTQVIEFTKQELVHMLDELGQAAAFAPHPYKKRVVAVYTKVADILDELQLEELGIERPQKRRRPSSESDLLFQFRITLLGVSPSIWRVIQVRDCTLGDLHEYIQLAMGWGCYHLHQFIIDGERYGPTSPDDWDFGSEMIDEDDVTLSGLLPKSGKRVRWTYEYDFGDDWRHEVLFEGYPPVQKRTSYPVCLGGERACPPEDVGGIWGYAEFLEALKDPNHERHEDFLHWSGPFDPEEFDTQRVTREMRKAIR